MFEARDIKTYDLLMKDPMKWLTRQDRMPVGRHEKELVPIALARLARSDVSVADSYLRREWAKSMSKPNLAWVRGHRPHPHDGLQRRLEGARRAAPTEDRLEVGHRIHRRDAPVAAR
ncbi:hypothetical protein G6F23_013913 [Rhizopus arrhizus]|nr:hypothetical protein G6F23_013913 [Rhizopus arrhizus]